MSSVFIDTDESVIPKCRFFQAAYFQHISVSPECPGFKLFSIALMNVFMRLA